MREICKNVWDNYDQADLATYTNDISIISEKAEPLAKAYSEAAAQVESTAWPARGKRLVSSAVEALRERAAVMEEVSRATTLDQYSAIIEKYKGEKWDDFVELREMFGVKAPASMEAIEILELKQGDAYGDYAGISFTVKNNLPIIVKEIYVDFNIQDADGNILDSGQGASNPIHLQMGATVPVESTVKAQYVQQNNVVVPVKCTFVNEKDEFMDFDYDSNNLKKLPL